MKKSGDVKKKKREKKRRYEEACKNTFVRYSEYVHVHTQTCILVSLVARSPFTQRFYFGVWFVWRARARPTYVCMYARACPCVCVCLRPRARRGTNGQRVGIIIIRRKINFTVRGCVRVFLSFFFIFFLPFSLSLFLSFRLSFSLCACVRSQARLYACVSSELRHIDRSYVLSNDE